MSYVSGQQDITKLKVGSLGFKDLDDMTEKTDPIYTNGLGASRENPLEVPEVEFARLRAKSSRSVAASYTYFAKAMASGLIKIGRSMEPDERVDYLAWQRGEPVVLVATIRGGRAEQAYHRIFKRHCVHGEWFSPHPEILAEIERLTEGQDTPLPDRQD